jgi:hydrogenase-4 membrane subunit HyfE
MTTDTAAGEVQDLRQQKKVITWLAEVFKLNPQLLNWGRAVMFLDVVLVPLVLLVAIGKEQYLLSAVR